MELQLAEDEAVTKPTNQEPKVRKYHCVDCYFDNLFRAFASGDPDSFEDLGVEEAEDDPT